MTAAHHRVSVLIRASDDFEWAEASVGAMLGSGRTRPTHGSPADSFGDGPDRCRGERL
jgi:hypothetical protein